MPHIHIYRDPDGWVKNMINGHYFIRRVLTCRCGMEKTQIRGGSW